jgi:hypothetical protein
MRFMMQYDPGHGDYSKERHDLFRALTLDELLHAIERDEGTKTTTMVPSGATAGPISVTTPAGTATSVGSFTP